VKTLTSIFSAGVLALLVSFVYVARARAQCDYTVPLGFTVTANFNTLNLHVPLACDENHTATATVRYWNTADGQSQADVGHPLVLDGINNQLNGKIFWLQEGVSYTVEVTVDDPRDGTNGQTVWSSTVTTRTTPVPPAPTQQVFCGPTGTDSPNCGAPGSPCRTIQQAHDRLDPSMGGEIMVQAGTYNESVTLSKNPPAGSMYVVTGLGFSNSVTLDAGTVLPNTGWSLYSGSPGNQIWVRDYTLPSTATQLNVVVQNNSFRLHRRTSPGEMNVQNPPPYTDWPAERFFYDASAHKLYVRFANGGAPGGSNVVKVSERDVAFIVRGARGWYLRNLNVKNYNRQAIVLGTLPNDPSNNATDAVVDNCRLSQLGGAGVYINQGSTGCLIQNTTSSDPRIGLWSYDAGKARAEEEVTGLKWVGSNVVIRHCTVTGTFDGIQENGAGTDPVWGRDSDVHDNVIGPLQDDGLEFEIGSNINIAAWNNVVRATNHGFASVPIYIGPTYVMYNDLVNCRGAGIKSGAYDALGSFGWLGIYQNTITSTERNFSAMHSVGTGPAPSWGNQHYLNNILVGVRSTTDDGPFVVQGNGDSEPANALTSTFNHDLLWYHQRSGGAIWEWRTLPNYNSAGPTGDLCSNSQSPPSLGFECAGVYGQPVFGDSANGDYSLAPGSPGINIGALIDGINTPSHTTALRYSGTGPDAGAHEYTGSSPQARARPVGSALELAISQPQPNPTRGEISFAIDLPRPIRTEARIYDVAGRLVRTLFEGTLPAGHRTLQWDGRRQDGSNASTGLFYLRVRIEDRHLESHVVMIR
jgi:hypothetical protein